MIEVFEAPDGWGWRLISFCGRPLVWSDDRFPTDTEANDAAKSYRSAFWRVAADVDHRQARAI